RLHEAHLDAHAPAALRGPRLDGGIGRSDRAERRLRRAGRRGGGRGDGRAGARRRVPRAVRWRRPERHQGARRPRARPRTRPLRAGRGAYLTPTRGWAMRRPILRYGEPVLHTPARPVAEITPTVEQLIDDMIETMHAAPGI